MLAELAASRATLESERQQVAHLRAESEAARNDYRTKLERLQERRDDLFRFGTPCRCVVPRGLLQGQVGEPEPMVFRHLRGRAARSFGRSPGDRAAIGVAVLAGYLAIFQPFK